MWLTCVIPPLSLTWLVFRRSRLVPFCPRRLGLLILPSGISVCVDLALEEAWNQDAALTAPPAHQLPNSRLSAFASLSPSCWPRSPVQRALILPFSLGNFPSPGAVHKVFWKRFLFLTSPLTFQHDQDVSIICAFYKGAGRKGSYDATVAWRGRMLWWFRLEAGSSVHIMVIQCYLLCLTVFLCKMKRKILPNWI